MPRDRIVEALYRAATAEAPWTDALALITGATGSNWTYYQEHDAASGALTRLLSDGAPNPENYLDNWSWRDPRLAYALRHPTQDLYTDYGMMGDEGVIDANDFYNDYLAAIDVRYTAASRIVVPQRPAGGGRIAYLGFNRRRRAGHVSQEHCDLLTAIRPHLTSAIAIETRLGAAAGLAIGLADALDALTYGIVIVGRGGAVRWANEAARRMLADGQGVAVELGVLEAAATAARDVLRRLIGDACRTAAGEEASPGGALLIPCAGPGGGAVEVLVAPLPRRAASLDTLGERGEAVVFLHDAIGSRFGAGEALAALYGLTPTEVRLATALADGMTLKEAAAAMGATHETARTYIKRIYSKTGTNTQAQLVRIILNGPASLVARQ